MSEPIRFLSVCSGIDAASVAWTPLGWRCVGFSEIDPQCNAVLAHHFPDVPNFGSLVGLAERYDGPDFDVLVGGTPCQSFSVAGLRRGLDDDRGNLAFEYLAVARERRPRWLVWENVPGVLSSNDGRDFGAIIGAMVELGYGVCWRILDAQYVRVESHPRAVPQRRRRVFVVGHLGDWRASAAVLLEAESLSRNPPPRRKTGSAVAALTRSGVGAHGADDNAAQASHLIAGTVSAKWHKGSGGPSGDECQNLVVCDQIAPPIVPNHYGDHESREGLLVSHTLRGEGHDAGEDGTGRGTPLIPFDATQLTSAENRSNPQIGDPCHTIPTNGEPPLIAFSCKDGGQDANDEVSPTLRAMPHDKSHPNAGGQVAVAIQGNATSPIVGDNLAPTLDQKAKHMAVAVDARQDPQVYDEHVGAIDASYPPQAVAVSVRGRDGGTDLEMEADDVSPALRSATGGSDKQHVMIGEWIKNSVVRRLTPRECERLQGFPDDWTLVDYARLYHRTPKDAGLDYDELDHPENDYRGKPKPMADGPRYRMLGNSMAVNVMRWIGDRIALYERLERTRTDDED